jgi:UDP-3-O-[3-hydroxymyristoyl] glucosamine N-acyltransferase
MMPPPYTLNEIAKFLHAELKGDQQCLIIGVAPLDKAEQGQVSFLGKVAGFVHNYRKHLASTKASAVILSAADAKDFSGNALIVDNPYVAYAKLTSWFCKEPKSFAYVHPQAVLGRNCNIHPSASIANCTIGNDVNIGADAIIGAGCVIGDNVTVDDGCHFYANVVIYYDVQIGKRVIIHSGAVIGADGFGMANDKGLWIKIHQLGSVIVGDDVEIGANTCVDRGALDDTVIENGVKLDNLIQIGHNARIGAHTAIAGCTAVGGGAIVGKYCMIGGDVTLNGHIEIADKTIITGSSTVGRSITNPGVYSSALTVQPHREWLKVVVQLPQLSKLINKFKQLGA